MIKPQIGLTEGGRPSHFLRESHLLVGVYNY